jgi:hypothetical protein
VRDRWSRTWGNRKFFYTRLSAANGSRRPVAKIIIKKGKAAGGIHCGFNWREFITFEENCQPKNFRGSSRQIEIVIMG